MASDGGWVLPHEPAGMLFVDGLVPAVSEFELTAASFSALNQLASEARSGPNLRTWTTSWRINQLRTFQ